MSRPRRPPPGSRHGRAGIRDVAAAAGVSITTVSDALNGKGRLPDATRRHVREVADRLGYRPSAAARTLRTGKSGLIGLTVTTYGDEPFTFTEFAYFAEMARAATSAALARGYALVILPADLATPRRVVERRPRRHRRHRPVRPGPGRQRTASGRASRRLRRPPGRHAAVTAWVDNDHEAAVLGILDHLAARRRPPHRPADRHHHRHLHPALDHRLPATGASGSDRIRSTRRYPAHDPCAGAVAADRLLARPDRPDAVYGLFDPNGTDLLAAARRYGLRVPEDLLLVCCSESTVYATTEPPITTLSLKPAPHRHGRRPAPHRRHRGTRPGPPRRAGDTDRADRPDLVAAWQRFRDGQSAPYTEGRMRASRARNGRGRDADRAGRLPIRAAWRGRTVPWPTGSVGYVPA